MEILYQARVRIDDRRPAIARQESRRRADEVRPERLKGSRVEVLFQLVPRRSGQARIGDQVRPLIARPQIARGLRDPQRRSRARGNDTAHLPTADNAVEDAVHAPPQHPLPTDRQLVVEAEHQPMRPVKCRYGPLVAQVEHVLHTRIAGEKVHVGAGLVGIADHFGERVVRDHAQSGRKPLLIFQLQRMIDRVGDVRRRPVLSRA